MKKLVTLSIFLTIAVFWSHAQTYSLDFKDPKNLVNAIFYAARTGDIDVLNNLPDPLLENDDYTESICLMDEENIDDFMVYFKNGKAGEVSYYSENNANFAKVAVSGINVPEKVFTAIVLVKRYENWFLFSMEE